MTTGTTKHNHIPSFHMILGYFRSKYYSKVKGREEKVNQAQSQYYNIAKTEANDFLLYCQLKALRKNHTSLSFRLTLPIKLLYKLVKNSVQES